ncbi:leucine rich repeat-containing protein [Besnoitia besnoiti]|uniref:Leucine rich repeat-containing protein n=1 Tax=Besnoitia besnoiti TaxID=94643 RepID=A0A2A9M0Z7_BESBE|nr:leucine rich repeat-containing protein [Besnoitia besnoiti]PFH31655.1 leucine rich repeat-containing protein [Besnoitia besnoiti]
MASVPSRSGLPLSPGKKHPASPSLLKHTSSSSPVSLTQNFSSKASLPWPARPQSPQKPLKGTSQRPDAPSPVLKKQKDSSSPTRDKDVNGGVPVEMECSRDHSRKMPASPAQPSGVHTPHTERTERPSGKHSSSLSSATSSSSSSSSSSASSPSKIPRISFGGGASVSGESAAKDAKKAHTKSEKMSSGEGPERALSTSPVKSTGSFSPLAKGEKRRKTSAGELPTRAELAVSPLIEQKGPRRGDAGGLRQREGEEGEKVNQRKKTRGSAEARATHAEGAGAAATKPAQKTAASSASARAPAHDGAKVAREKSRHLGSDVSPAQRSPVRDGGSSVKKLTSLSQKPQVKSAHASASSASFNGESASATSGGTVNRKPHAALSCRAAAKLQPREAIPHLTLPRIAELAAEARALGAQGPQARGAGEKKSQDRTQPGVSAANVNIAAIAALDLSEREAERVDDLSCYKSLKRLDVSGNKLAEGLGFLSMNLELRWLKAAGSLLEGGETLKYAIMNLSNLLVLDLSGNQISRLEDFAPLKSLKTLVLSGNEIQRVSFSSSPLSTLECLILSRNKIQEVEKPPRPLTHLKKLSLSDNRLKVFPFSGQFPALAELRLNGNSLLSVGTGVICMSELKILDLGRNQFHRIEGVKALAQHLKLTQLNLLGNPLMTAPAVLKDVEMQVVASLPSLKIFNSKPLEPRPVNPRKELWKQRQEAARKARANGAAGPSSEAPGGTEAKKDAPVADAGEKKKAFPHKGGPAPGRPQLKKPFKKPNLGGNHHGGAGQQHREKHEKNGEKPHAGGFKRNAGPATGESRVGHAKKRKF